MVSRIELRQQVHSKVFCVWEKHRRLQMRRLQGWPSTALPSAHGIWSPYISGCCRAFKTTFSILTFKTPGRREPAPEVRFRGTFHVHWHFDSLGRRGMQAKGPPSCISCIGQAMRIMRAQRREGDIRCSASRGPGRSRKGFTVGLRRRRAGAWHALKVLSPTSLFATVHRNRC